LNCFSINVDTGFKIIVILLFLSFNTFAKNNIMPNNNLADLSVFEQIQSGQHTRIGISSMSVFNSPEDVQKMKVLSDSFIKKFDDMRQKYKKYEDLKKNLEKADEAWKQAAKIVDDFQKEYDKTVAEIDKSLESQAKKAVDAKAKGDEKLYTTHKAEQKAISDMRRKIQQKKDSI
jgi:hypothetical protein